MARMLLSVAPFAAGCSVLPPRSWPAMAQADIVATFPVADGAAVELPVSSPDLTILSLTVEPPPQGEAWRDGRRLLVPPPGCRELVVRCRYRAYARDGVVPAPQQLFPGATITAHTP